MAIGDKRVALRRLFADRLSGMFLKVAGVGFLYFVVAAMSDASEPPRSAPSVSLISLIATPEKFEGKYIRIEGVGYLDSKHSLSALFLTREDKLKGNGANGIYLYLSSFFAKIDRLNNQFIIVQGVFRSADKGHLDSFQGSLVDIDRIEALPSRVN
jgi:hypothetical protein